MSFRQVAAKATESPQGPSGAGRVPDDGGSGRQRGAGEEGVGEMKALRVAILTLVLLMAAGLANSVYLTARCDDWTARLNAVTSAAESGDWAAAQREMAALQADWQDKQSYLHITLQHEEINEADTLLHQCALYVRKQDNDALSNAAVQLALEFDRLAELEQLSIKNVL